LHVIFDGRTIADHFPGIGRYAYNLARALLERPGPPELTILHDPRQPNTRFDLARLSQSPGARLVAAAAPIFAVSTQWRLPAQLRNLGGEVYHSPYYLMPYRPGIAAVVTLFDLMPMRYPEYMSALARLVFAVTVRLALRASARIITISQASANDASRVFRLDPGQLVVIPAAPGPEFRPQPSAAQAAVRQRLGLPARFLLYFGSNKPHKNLQRLIRAHLRLGAAAAEVPLVIAGHWDPRYPEARAAVEQTGAQDKVRFIGPVGEADLPALYSAAEAFVFPSEYEGFGLPPLEAMACGTAVVCSRAASLSEVVGTAALLFDPHAVDSISACLARVIAEPALRADLRQRGLERASQFTWDEAAVRTLDVYESVRNK
jgi:glycosyltransferase involved in cell wall biosynthesis